MQLFGSGIVKHKHNFQHYMCLLLVLAHEGLPVGCSECSDQEARLMPLSSSCGSLTAPAFTIFLKCARIVACRNSAMSALRSLRV
jgi:hypothetical protein